MCASDDQATCSGSSWSQGWIIYMDANNNGNFDTATDTLVRVHDALAGGVSVATTPAALGIVFRPSGPADAARTFQVCKPGFIGRNIALNATGRAVSTPTTAVLTSC
jgi:type IV fimbrial biogenesis protein FimT